MLVVIFCYLAQCSFVDLLSTARLWSTWTPDDLSFNNTFQQFWNAQYCSIHFLHFLWFVSMLKMIFFWAFLYHCCRSVPVLVLLELARSVFGNRFTSLRYLIRSVQLSKENGTVELIVLLNLRMRMLSVLHCRKVLDIRNESIHTHMSVLVILHTFQCSLCMLYYCANFR